ncbi:SUMF1/EgtB/PvdO family nonheme iron enzyme [Erythrobacter sp. EC-HK427]|uniref:SUMF1/EgtB/PvdO family nonheme iron enzyme n=1 Tax=Erythrobacter sp. EC-HK427 TaxID=2038396 RepID=UPI0018FE2FC4|nr:SUMF1/EgtB/PvdO family nonheme iron enzyme [Erythrobacter sp. EC-HK427]
MSGGAETEQGFHGNTVEIGEEFAPCDGCPAFIRVPQSPADLRPITFVSKFELTWNNYWQAVDAGACPAPILGENFGRAIDLNERSELVAQLRLDWPIAELNDAEIECYVAWLESVSGADLALPTVQEWEWFASSGNPSRRFPWGDDIDPTREALSTRDLVGIPFASPWSGGRPSADIFPHVQGKRVGSFPPSEWGLYDVLGNVTELTEERITAQNRSAYEDQFDFSNNPPQLEEALMKGYQIGQWSSPVWQDGIERTSRVSIYSYGFSAPVGIRLVIVGERQ